MDAAQPLAPRDRAEFLREATAELEKYELLGPGLVARVVAKLQRQHLNPPSFRHGHGGGKWNR